MDLQLYHRQPCYKTLWRAFVFVFYPSHDALQIRNGGNLNIDDNFQGGILLC